MSANSWSVVVGASSTVLALAGVAIALIAYRSDRRRSRFERACALHRDLTTGEVATARNVAGHFHYGGFTGSGTSPDVASGLHAYFLLLWSFQRLEAGRTALVRDSLRPNGSIDSVVRYLDGLIASDVAEYACALAIMRRKIAESSGISDWRSAAPFVRLLKALQKRGLVDPSYQPLVCLVGGCPCTCHQMAGPSRQ